MTMHALKARVKNGRLVLDEPTDLPEGEGVELVPVDEILASGGDNLNDAERAALHRELELSLAEADSGQTEDFGTLISELRARM